MLCAVLAMEMAGAVTPVAAEPEEPPIAMDGVGQEEPLAALLASEN